MYHSVYSPCDFCLPIGREYLINPGKPRVRKQQVDSYPIAVDHPRGGPRSDVRCEYRPNVVRFSRGIPALFDADYLRHVAIDLIRFLLETIHIIFCSDLYCLVHLLIN